MAKTSVKTIRMRDGDYIKFSNLCKENNITQAKGIEILLDNYSKRNKLDYYEGEVKIMELTRENILIEEEYKVLLELFDYKKKELNRYKNSF